MNINDKKTIMVVAALMFFALFISYQLGIKPANIRIMKLDKKIERREMEFYQLSLLKKEYKEIVDETKAMERRILKTAKGVTLPSLLENVARTTGLSDKMTGLKIREPVKSKNYSENGVEITLKNISIDELMEFVYSLEALPYIIKVKGLKMKTTFGSEPKYINLTLLVSLFAPN